MIAIVATRQVLTIAPGGPLHAVATHPVLLFLAYTAIVVGLLGLLFCGYMLRRNEKVYQERLRMIYTDMFAYEAGPTYNEMMCKFWKPVNSFYPEDAHEQA
jgi:hypothetical protein